MNDLQDMEELMDSVETACSLDESLLSVKIVENVLDNATGDYLVAHYELVGEKGLFYVNYNDFNDASEEDKEAVRGHAHRIAKNPKKKFEFPDSLQGLLGNYYLIFSKEIEVRRLTNKMVFLGKKVVKTRELLDKVKAANK